MTVDSLNLTTYMALPKFSLQGMLPVELLIELLGCDVRIMKLMLHDFLFEQWLIKAKPRNAERASSRPFIPAPDKYDMELKNTIRKGLVNLKVMEEEPVDLWVKAGSDGIRLGGDPLCQQIFMILVQKSLNPDSGLKFNVRTVNEAKPPAEFRQAGLRHAPALQHGEDVILSQPDEIIEYIDKAFPFPSLRCDCSSADQASANLFRAFAFYIKEVNNDPKLLVLELSKLDQYLSAIDTPFLAADHLTHIDCYVLPKLHTIRIAADALKDFKIPETLHSLWGYMERGYNTDAFKRSCPSDQEIILYWAERPDTPNLPSTKRSQLYRQKPTQTLTVPVVKADGDRNAAVN